MVFKVEDYPVDANPFVVAYLYLLTPRFAFKGRFNALLVFLFIPCVVWSPFEDYVLWCFNVFQDLVGYVNLIDPVGGYLFSAATSLAVTVDDVPQVEHYIKWPVFFHLPGEPVPAFLLDPGELL